MSTDLSVARQADASTLDFTDAEVSALLARQDFADTKEKHGAQTPLKLFNRQVSHWANQFTNRDLSDFAYTIGSFMSGETHSFTVSRACLQKRFAAFHNGLFLSVSSIKRYTKILTDNGIVIVEAQKKRGERSRYPGQWASNTYTVDFSKVLVDGIVKPHDFMDVPPAAEKPEETPEDPAIYQLSHG